jgi:DNA-binding transcriptional regulator YiaG
MEYDMALQEDLARLTAVVANLHRVNGLAERLRRSARLEASEVGKLCGVTAATIFAWERGELEPTTNQALTWMSVLWGRQSLPPVLQRGEVSVASDDPPPATGKRRVAS